MIRINNREEVEGNISHWLAMHQSYLAKCVKDSKKDPPLEKVIVNQIRKYLKTVKGCFFWKEHGGAHGVAGIPDIIVCYQGMFIGLEVKRPKIGKATKLQVETIKKINAAGGWAFVVTSVEEVQTVIETLQSMGVEQQT